MPGRCRTIWEDAREGTAFLTTNLCKCVLNTLDLNSFPKESLCRASQHLSLPIFLG